MKKTIVALMALAGMVMAAEQTIKVETSIMPSAAPTWVSQKDDVDVTWTNADWGNMLDNSKYNTPGLLADDFKKLGIEGTGHYAFNSVGSDLPSPPISYSSETGAFTLTGTSTLYANVMSVSDIMQGYDLGKLDTLTFAFEGVYSLVDNQPASNDTFFALFRMDSDGTLYTLNAMYGDKSSLKDSGENGGNVWTNGKVSYDYKTSGWNLSSTDNIVMLVNHNTATTFTISDMKVTAAVTVPEPATATLSVLALAGLTARRRRATR